MLVPRICYARVEYCEESSTRPYLICAKSAYRVSDIVYNIM